MLNVLQPWIYVASVMYTKESRLGGTFQNKPFHRENVQHRQKRDSLWENDGLF